MDIYSLDPIMVVYELWKGNPRDGVDFILNKKIRGDNIDSLKDFLMVRVDDTLKLSTLSQLATVFVDDYRYKETYDKVCNLINTKMKSRY